MKSQLAQINASEVSIQGRSRGNNGGSAGNSAACGTCNTSGHLLSQQEPSLYQLLQLCLQTDADVFWTTFVQRSRAMIAGVIIRSIRNRGKFTNSLVDDLVQDTYLKLCASNFHILRAFKCQHEDAFIAFLKVVSRNVVHDHFRGLCSLKRGGGKELEDIDAHLFSVQEKRNSIAHIERQILLNEIRIFLAASVRGQHARRDCRIFWLYYRYGLPAKAISEIPRISLTVKGVESTLLRLTRQIKHQLSRF
jgi:RNA polymerase sigma-70 factor (ECF subfamily)